VRESEELVRGVKARKKTGKKGKTRTAESPFVSSLQEDLQQVLGTKVRLRPGKRGGRLEIYFYSQEELERLIEMLKAGTA
jgi:ParB family chromosome partitioning protein